MPEMIWFKVDPAKFNQPRQEIVHGVGINVQISPHDVPEAVTGYYDINAKRFIIEFRYIGSEPQIRNARDAQVVAHVGKNSGRIYKFEVDVDSTNVGAVALAVQVRDSVRDAITRLKADRSHERRLANYDVADSVFRDEESNILRPLTACPRARSGSAATSH